MESGTICEEEVDRLSNLPDDLIYKILSHVDILYCIRLSALSSRWRFILSSLPNLKFSSHLLSDHPYHVSDVLRTRNNKIDVSSVSMDLHPEFHVLKLNVLTIIEYAFSHNVQQLSISGGEYHIRFSPSELSCKSLKHLMLIRITIYCESDSTPGDLSALTTLHLKNVKLCHCISSIIAMCPNLKNLTLERCQVFEPQDSIIRGIAISNSQLVSLTLKNVVWHYVYCVYVDTPQLKNLIYVGVPQGFSVKLAISAPHLTFLRIKASYFPNVSLNGGFPYLDKVDLCIFYLQKTDVDSIFDMFQRLHGVKSLALSLEIVELLSTLEQVTSHQPSPFPSLKSLKIYPSSKGLKTSILWELKNRRLKTSLEILKTQPDEEQEAMKMKLSAQVTKYLLGTSSNATFTMISHEEARVIKITKVAYRLMAALQKILEETEAEVAKMEWKNTVAHNCSPGNFFIHVVEPPGDTKMIFRIVHNIELLLTKVLASKRVEMHECYSRLCAKTKTVVNKMLADIKTQCDVQHQFSNGFLDDKIALLSLEN